MSELNLKPDTVLLRPRITEKASLSASGENVYVFEVLPRATKSSVSASLKAIYGVVPEKVRLLALPKKQVFLRGKWGVKGGGKKAYVYLKQGDKIEIL